MRAGLYMDVAVRKANCSSERICGDSVVCKRLSSGRRTLVVLSDGMGHGIKANVLSTLTSSMAINLMKAGKPVADIAAMILRTLPVCSIRKISYSTFTILDMDNLTGEVAIAQYDNPRVIVMRGGAGVALDWRKIESRTLEGRLHVIYATNFVSVPGDRIIAATDGVTQSGQREGAYKFGWGEDNLREFISFISEYNRDISASDMAGQVISKASANDRMTPRDDMTCVVVEVRHSRDMMLISCPPALREDHARLASHVASYHGRKVICGYHVAEIIAGELGLAIERELRSGDPSLRPAWHIRGFDQVTDGLITSNRVLSALESGQRPLGRNSADTLTRSLLDSDNIDMVIGTMRSQEREQWQAGEFELRRSILQRIAELLESRYGKQVGLTYI